MALLFERSSTFLISVNRLSINNLQLINLRAIRH